jgi:hypothetical protein
MNKKSYCIKHRILIGLHPKYLSPAWQNPDSKPYDESLQINWHLQKLFIPTSPKSSSVHVFKQKFSTHSSSLRVRRGAIVYHKGVMFITLPYAVKSKAVPLPPCRRQGGEGYSSYSFLTSALDGMSGQLHAPFTLYPGYPFNRRLGGSQSWPEHTTLEEKAFACAGDRTPVFSL